MKLDIPFCLIDESIVDYGFRVLMSGYQPETFANNPVLLLQHKRTNDSNEILTEDAVLPLGRWNNIRIEGSKLVAEPEFDEDDEFAMKIAKKVKNGYLNAASVWLDPIEVSDDDELKLPGQYGPTLTKWGIRESSVVDIGNCRGALAMRNSAGKKLLLNGNNDADAKEINNYLKTFLPNNNSNMDKKILAAKLGLNENADDNTISEKLAAVINSASQLTALNQEVATLKLSVSTKDTEISNLKTAAQTAKMEDLKKEMTEKKLTAEEVERYTKLAAKDDESFNTVKEIVAAIKPYASIESRLSGGGAGETDELKEMLKLSGRDLFLEGKFEKLQALSPEHYKAKYKEYFGKEPQA